MAFQSGPSLLQQYDSSPLHSYPLVVPLSLPLHCLHLRPSAPSSLLSIQFISLAMSADTHTEPHCSTFPELIGVTLAWQETQCHYGNAQSITGQETNTLSVIFDYHISIGANGSNAGLSSPLYLICIFWMDTRWAVWLLDWPEWKQETAQNWWSCLDTYCMSDFGPFLDRKAKNTKENKMCNSLLQLNSLHLSSSIYFPLFHHLIEHQESHSSLDHNSYIFYRCRAPGDIREAIYEHRNASSMRVKYGRL